MKSEQTIILLRHGESADKQPGQPDFERMLTDRGRRSIEQLALELSGKKIFPDSILSSDAVRAVQTTQAVLSACSALSPYILYNHDLFHGMDDVYLDAVVNLDKPMKRLMVVGHNPSISSFIGKLTGNYKVSLHPGQAALIHFHDGTDFKSIAGAGVLEGLIGPFL